MYVSIAHPRSLMLSRLRTSGLLVEQLCWRQHAGA
jgi:hypothetical protein